MKIKQVNCFCTDHDGSGNPAAIVLEFTGSHIEKQRLAKKLNLPVTVFVSYKGQYPFLEFFYPSTKMPLCIHGALAAAKVLFEVGQLDI